MESFLEFELAYTVECRLMAPGTGETQLMPIIITALDIAQDAFINILALSREDDEAAGVQFDIFQHSLLRDESSFSLYAHDALRFSAALLANPKESCEDITNRFSTSAACGWLSVELHEAPEKSLVLRISVPDRINSVEYTILADQAQTMAQAAIEAVSMSCAAFSRR